jgi:hypothetical protein
MWVDLARNEVSMAITVEVNRKKPLTKIETYEWDPNVHPYVTQFYMMEKTGDDFVSSNTL